MAFGLWGLYTHHEGSQSEMDDHKPQRNIYSITYISIYIYHNIYIYIIYYVHINIYIYIFFHNTYISIYNIMYIYIILYI